MDKRQETFPLDEITLSLVESSLYVTFSDEIDERGCPVTVDGGITLTSLLAFMSGDQSDADHPLVRGVSVIPGTHWSERDLLKSLVSEVRRLRALVPEESRTA